MQRLPHNERYFLLKDRVEGQDELVDFLLENPDDAILLAAQDIFSDPLKRAYVEGCLTASQDYERISAITRVSEEVLQRYAKIYYDVADVDALTLLSIVDREESESAKSLKRWALSQGLEFITWRLGQSTDVSPVDGLKTLFSDCYYKSKEAFFNPNSTEASKESTKWVKLSTDIARLLKTWLSSDEDETRQEILVQIKTIEPNFESADDLNLPDN